MTAVLAFLKAFWPEVLAAVAGAVLSIWLTHKVDSARYDYLSAKYDAYRAEAKARYQQAQLDAAAKTAALQKTADDAHNAFLEEQSANAQYRDTHPDRAVRLCISTPGGGVPPAGQGHPAAGAPSGDVRPVPDRDTGVRATGAGPDIAPVLRGLAARADEVAAELRECQTNLPQRH